ATYYGFLSRLPDEIDRAKLSPAAQADFDILANDVAGNVFTLRQLHPFERDPLVYAALMGDSVYAVLDREGSPIDVRVRAATERMKKLPALVEQAKANLKAPPKPHTEVAIRQNKGSIAFYDGGIADFLAGASPDAKAACLDEAKRAADALRGYETFLES